MNDIMTIDGIDCYERDGTAYLKLETVARGLGFTQEKNGVEYVKWERVSGYLDELGFSPEVGKDAFIPENIFYRLAMKAKNETAERFQAKIADEVIPTIRRHGAYMTPEALGRAIAEPEFGIRILTALKDERDKRRELEAANASLLEALEDARPKVEHYNAMMERNDLTTFRETAKLLKVKEDKFIGLLLSQEFVYRDKRHKLMPMSEKNRGYFEVREYVGKSGPMPLQTLITAKGRERFRRLCAGM